MKKWIMYIVLASLLLLTACGKEAQGLKVGEQEHLPNGDLREVTASADTLPSFLDDKPEDMRLVYEVAGRATDILEWMPCYCGCGESAGHGSNMNCFIDEIQDDGAVVWNDHSTRCQVCLDIAVNAVYMTQEGQSLEEIRQTIDDAYGKGYAEPTNTPMPS